MLIVYKGILYKKLYEEIKMEYKNILMALFIGVAIISLSLVGLYMSENNKLVDDISNLEMAIPAMEDKIIELIASNEGLESSNILITEKNKELQSDINFLQSELENVELNIEDTLTEDPSLDLLLEHIYDNNGNIDYLVEDLDDDELDLIVERIDFINKIKSDSVDFIKKELFDEVDKMEIILADNSTYEFDEDDLERLKINDDDDEILIQDIDFEDGDAEVLVSGSFEDDDDLKFRYEVIISFRDAEVDDFDDIEIVFA